MPSTHDLSPIPIANTNDPSSPLPISTRLRGRVEQQVGGLANSATKVISGVGGVVDSSFTAIRGLLGPSGDSQSAPADESSIGAGQAIVSALTRSSFGLLRRGASFSVASAVKKGDLEETSGRQLIEVPRFGHLEGAKYPPSEGEHSYDSPEDGNSSEDDGGGDPRLEHSSVRDRSDTRSIRSFSSMLSKDAHHEDKKERISLSERLASMSALSRLTLRRGNHPHKHKVPTLLRSNGYRHRTLDSWNVMRRI
ncbi:uncharacterized protein EI90DRAFT_2357974 [Cantharellus anzutake]|uniref:uncharacterized protein n=1 Tax=Cantharellus anzutake TaxID=1750568 RepID=UPI001906EA41|nr:uncharacterized protein EI90DRAFT_2357974 [Cantharellus anzutake]KAF8324323.1 hypothetical protein EI90DRAFT_2357974 [Cantharellus anzutake]